MRFSTKLLLGILLVIIFGQFTPYTFIPIQGDSMNPTIPDGSLQLIYETNTAEVDDIIVFQSQQAGEQVIIHRILEEEEGGFITIGDNNERTDQRTGEPLVQNQNIIGQAVEIQGQPIYIPFVGSLILFVSTNLIESLLLLLGAFGVHALYNEWVHDKKERGVLTYNDIIFPIFLAVFLVLTVVILVGASTVTVPMTYTTSDTTAQQQYVIHVDEQNPTETISLDINDGLGVEIYSSSYDIIETNTNQTTAELTVVVPPQDKPGSVNGYVRVYRFPPILPAPWLQYLVTISPLIPALMSSASVLGPLYGLYLLIGNPYDRVPKPRNRIAKKIYERL